MKATTQQKSPGREPESLWVEDTNARPPDTERTHEILNDDGSTELVTFKQGEKVKLPAAKAAKFLKDEAFIVTDRKGNRIQPIILKDKDAPGGLVLEPGEVIAKWDELTLDALLRRVQMSPGGEKASKQWGKVKLIAHLDGAAENPGEGGKDAPDANATTDTGGGDAPGAAEAEDMSSDDVDAMFDGEDD